MNLIHVLIIEMTKKNFVNELLVLLCPYIEKNLHEICILGAKMLNLSYIK